MSVFKINPELTATFEQNWLELVSPLVDEPQPADNGSVSHEDLPDSENLPVDGEELTAEEDSSEDEDDTPNTTRRGFSLRDIIMVGRLAAVVGEQNGRWDILMRDALDRLLPVYVWAGDDARAEKIKAAMDKWDSEAGDYGRATIKAELPASAREAGAGLACAVLDGLEDVAALFGNVDNLLLQLVKHYNALDEDKKEVRGGLDEAGKATLKAGLEAFFESSSNKDELVDDLISAWDKINDPTEWSHLATRKVDDKAPYRLPLMAWSDSSLKLLRVGNIVFQQSIQNCPGDIPRFQSPGTIENGDMTFDTPGAICIALQTFIYQFLRFRRELELDSTASGPAPASVGWEALAYAMWTQHEKYPTDIPRLLRLELKGTPFSNVRVYMYTRLTNQLQVLSEFAAAKLPAEFWDTVSTLAAQPLRGLEPDQIHPYEGDERELARELLKLRDLIHLAV